MNKTLNHGINSFNNFGLMLLAFIMPLHKNVFSWVLILYALFWIVSGDWRIKIKNLKENRFPIIFFITIYLLYIIGLTYTINIESGLFDIQVKLCLFAFPIILFSIWNKINLKPILLSFIAGCVASFIICLSVAIYKYIDSGSTTGFYYTELSIVLHPGYLAMYVDFAIASLLWFEFERKTRNLFYSKVITIILAFILSFFVVLLSSKIGIIILIAIFIYAVVYLILKFKKYIIGIGLIAAGSLFFFLLLSFNTEIYNRFNESRKSLFDKNYDPTGGTYNRRHTWKAGVIIIEDNILTGVGTGDSKDELLKVYKREKMESALEKKLNAHNQFIQTFIAIGILGFLSLLALFIIPFIISFKEKQRLYMMFLIIVFINFLVESMLETQAGVVFFAFFNTLLFIDLKHNNLKVESNETFLSFPE